MAQPNILLIMADQLAAPFLPAHGHPVVQTPALDSLADRSVVFDRAYANSPLCAPSRFSMMSGRLNSTIGAYDNASEFPSTVPTFAHYLRRSGYRTCLTGKMHFVGADQLHGFEERTTTDIYPADFGWTPNWEDFDHRFAWWYHNLDSVVHAGVAEVTNQLDYDDEVGFHAVRKLRDYARLGRDQPWFLTASFTHPHDPYVTRQRYWNLYDHDDIDMPRTKPPSADMIDPHSARLRHVSDMQFSDTGESVVTDDQVRNARHAYYGSISYIDEWVGTLVRTLEDTGQADTTVILFTADHGDMLGERGLWYKMSFFEHAARVPLFISAPDRFEAGRRVTDCVGLHDLLPTLLDIAEIETDLPDEVVGRSLVPLCAGDREPDRTVLGEYLGEGAVAPIFMLRRGSLKYIFSEPDPEQLYDLATDPDEVTNLAAGVASADVQRTVEEFRAEIHDRWNPARVRAEVVANQNERRLVNEALRTGTFTPWDFQPQDPAANRFMRNHLDLNEVEAGRRFPPA